MLKNIVTALLIVSCGSMLYNMFAALFFDDPFTSMYYFAISLLLAVGFASLEAYLEGADWTPKED